MMFKKIAGIFLCCAALQVSAGGDTLKLTYDKADSLFLKKNFALLAAQFNISAAKALKLQSKLYPNPQIYAEQSLVNKYTRSGYDTDPTKTGNTETILQVQQLILLAGKRNKQIKIADLNAKMAESDFENLIRTLKLQLHNDLSQLYYNNRSITLLKEEQQSIGALSGSLETQTGKGYISLSEIVRIKSLLLEIDKSVTDYTIENYNLIAEINTIMGNTADAVVKPMLMPKEEGLNLLPVTNYLDSAAVYNPETKAYNYRVDIANAQYNLNRVQAVPDANVQFVYDKSGNYIKNYYGLGLGIQLPTWNRNQGNTRAAKYQISQTENDLKQQQLTVATTIVASYNTYLNNQKLLDNYKSDYEKQLLQLMDNVLESYRKRLISLNEFMNYYEGYKQSYLSLLDMRSQLLQNVEQLNFLVGKSIIKYY